MAKKKLEVANCDFKQIDNINIESLIRVIRGQQVMLDSDLSMLYRVETKRLNEQVKRNIDRFPADFMFQLTKEETVCLRSQFVTLNNEGNAKQRIILIDNFIDDRVLSMLTKRADGVSATIHTRYNEQFLTDLKKHNAQYPEIEFIQLPHRNHDRFLIIDDKVYFIGASLKDIGTGLCAVAEMEIAPEMILGLLK